MADRASSTRIRGNFLVRRNQQSHSDESLEGSAHSLAFPILASDVSLSFWGGIDPVTGVVVDATHPLHKQSVHDAILCLPSGRGSCTASQVLLELILNRIGPRAIVMRDVDGLACVGAIVASEVFRDDDHDGSNTAGHCIPDIVCVGEEGFRKLLENVELRESSGSYGAVLSTGELVVGDITSVNETLSTSNLGASPDPDEREVAVSLTNQEETMLDECASEAERMALYVMFRYARLTSSEPSYVPVTNSHIDGCTYIGPGGLRFVQMLVEAGGQVKVPTTLNSVSTDRQRWRALGVPESYARNSIALGDAYLRLGCQPSFTCAPYLLSSPPRLGDNIAWGESNAVVYANSVLGARTEKYADYLDICCAISGYVPAVGVHLTENRVPTVVLDATDLLLDVEALLASADLDMIYPILGHVCGTLSDGKVPILIGFEKWASRITSDNLKAFCAAFGTTGSSPLIHIAGITPEAADEVVVHRWAGACGDQRSVISRELFEETFRTLDSGGAVGLDDRVQLVALGNPHLSSSECGTLAELVESVGSPKNPDVRVVACISREVMSSANERHVQTLTRWGVEFVNDTCWCMLLDPPVIPPDKAAKVLTNSGKYSHYGPGLTNRSFRFGSFEDCIRTATTGTYPALGTSRFSRQFTSSQAPFVGSMRGYSMLTVHALQKVLRLRS